MTRPDTGRLWTPPARWELADPRRWHDRNRAVEGWWAIRAMPGLAGHDAGHIWKTATETLPYPEPRIADGIVALWDGPLHEAVVHTLDEAARTRLLARAWVGLNYWMNHNEVAPGEHLQRPHIEAAVWRGVVAAGPVTKLNRLHLLDQR